MLPFYIFNEDEPSQPINTSPVVDTVILNNELPKKIIKPVDVVIISVPEPIVRIKEPSIKSSDIKNNNIEIVLKKEPKILSNKNVVRAVLAKGLYNKEPVGDIVLPLVLNDTAASRVFYFTEIINMKGQYLYHLWLRNGQMVYKRRIGILGNRWRASTNKLIPYSKVGSWTVRLVNEQGVILNEIQFETIK